MKIYDVLVLILAFALVLCSCSGGLSESSGEEPEASVPSGSEAIEEGLPEESESDVSDSDDEPKIKISEMLSPYAQLGDNAKTPWDMIIHDGYLYVGGGDYDVNISPVHAYRFNLSTEEWEKCGSIPDEQIRNFLVFDGELYIPGTDPTSDWSFGNFYRLEGSEFVTYRTIPNGVHCFDLEKLDNKLFAALGVKHAGFPVVVSTDNGKSFQSVPVIKDDHSYIPEERVYTLFRLGDSLYAVLGNNIYRYDDGAFRFECSWANKFVQTYRFYTPIGARTVFKDKVYFTSGCLFAFKDVNNLEYIPFDNQTVSDVLVYNGRLYTLSFTQNENGIYVNTIKCSADGESFETVFEFEYACSAISFVINGEDAYVGIGGTSGNNKYKGRIFKIEDII